MSKGSSPAPQQNDEAREGLASQLAKARLERIKGGGVSGAQASSIGLTLVGCIIAGAGAGWWLDKRFGTAYWTPILFLVGVAAGFRQMMLTIRDANALEARRKAEQKSEREAVALQNAVQSTNAISGLTSDETQPDATLDKRVRPRVFQVPAPPTASFESSNSASLKPIEYSIDRTEDDLDEQTLTQRLLGEELSDEPNANDEPK